MRVFIQHSNEIAVRNNILESSRMQWKQQATLASLNRDLANIVWTCLWPRKWKWNLFCGIMACLWHKKLCEEIWWR